jgi:hypothetical protein
MSDKRTATTGQAHDLTLYIFIARMQEPLGSCHLCFQGTSKPIKAREQSGAIHVHILKVQQNFSLRARIKSNSDFYEIGFGVRLRLREKRGKIVFKSS